jgi:hypothetical protein
MPEPGKKNILIVHGAATGSHTIAEQLQTALKYKGISADITGTRGTKDLQPCMDRIKAQAADYQGVILMNLADFEVARYRSAQIPDMYEWAAEVKQHVPNVIVYDDSSALGETGKLRLRSIGIPQQDILDSAHSQVADAMVAMCNPRRGAERQ